MDSKLANITSAASRLTWAMILIDSKLSALVKHALMASHSFFRSMFGAVISLAFAANALVAQAAPVTITNGDFETPTLTTDDTFTNTFSITGWATVTSSGGGYGVERLAQSHFATGQPRAIDGNQVAYSNNGPHVLSQNTSVSVTLGTVYTLSISVGDRNDTAFTGYTFGLFTSGGVPLMQETNAVTPADGTWVNRSLTYTPTAGDPNLGKIVQVRIGSTSGGGQTVFDAVALDATVAPEPSGCALLVGGAGVLMFLRRRGHS